MVAEGHKNEFLSVGGGGPANRNGKAFGRYFDPKFKAVAVKIHPGEYYASNDPGEMMVTTLGSCISVCLRDPTIGVGGMNHFMLPTSSASEMAQTDRAARYGNHAMELLINGVLSMGGQRSNLEIKVFGGGNVTTGAIHIGSRNADFVEHYLAQENLDIVASDLRGDYPRRVHYFPSTGRVMMRQLRRTDNYKIYNKELALRAKIAEAPATEEGSVELFD